MAIFNSYFFSDHGLSQGFAIFVAASLRNTLACSHAAVTHWASRPKRRETAETAQTLTNGQVPSSQGQAAMISWWGAAGWWFQPLWKIWRSIEWLFPIYGKIKHVPNHQPDVISCTWLWPLWHCNASRMMHYGISCSDEVQCSCNIMELFDWVFT